MFNFSSVNTAEVNASSQRPLAPVLSIVAAEDINVLTWNSPALTDFFVIYWSDKPFDVSDAPGVHKIKRDDLHTVPIPVFDLITKVSYSHSVPASFSLRTLYYRVGAVNASGEILSNQVDSYNFRIATYEDLYTATLEELLLNFTPELKLQYQDSILWKSFVEALCSELAQGRFEIKEALKQLNLQKAVDVFLNLWNKITGISRVNLTDTKTGLLVPENDAQYRQRLVDSIFWDKISNVALKKTMLLKLGYDADIVDTGVNADIFRNVPEPTTTRRIASYGSAFIPGEKIWFLNIGQNASARCVSDNGSTLVFDNYYNPPGDNATDEFFNPALVPSPSGTPGTGDGAAPYSLWSVNSFSFAVTLAPASGGQITHEPIRNVYGLAISSVAVGAPITFLGSGAQGIVRSFGGGVLTFEKVGTILPTKYDIVKAPIVSFGGTVLPVAVLTSDVTTLTSTSTKANSKILSNIYSVNLGSKHLDDVALNAIYDEISPLAALGNVLMEILQDVALEFNDWNATLGNIPYGPIFMGAPPYNGAIVKSTEDNSWPLNLPYTQSFDSGVGVWIAPPGITSVVVTVWGPGGNGSATTVIGTDLIVNGSFSSDLLSWHQSDTGNGLSSWSLSYGGSMKLKGDGARRQQTISTVVGQTYSLTFSLISIDNWDVRLQIGTAPDLANLFAATPYAVAGTYSISFVATSSSSVIQFFTSHNASVYLDNVSCHNLSSMSSASGGGGGGGSAQKTFTVIPGNTYSYSIGSPGSVLPVVAGLKSWFYADGPSGVIGMPGMPGQDSVPVPSSPDNPGAGGLGGVGLYGDANYQGVAGTASSYYRDNYVGGDGGGGEGAGGLGAVMNIPVPTAATAGGTPGGGGGGRAGSYAAALGGGGRVSLLWYASEVLYLDNQWDMNDGKIFYGNDGPDDIAVLTRNS